MRFWTLTRGPEQDRRYQAVHANRRHQGTSMFQTRLCRVRLIQELTSSLSPNSTRAGGVSLLCGRERALHRNSVQASPRACGAQGESVASRVLRQPDLGRRSLVTCAADGVGARRAASVTNFRRSMIRYRSKADRHRLRSRHTSQSARQSCLLAMTTSSDLSAPSTHRYSVWDAAPARSRPRR